MRRHLAKLITMSKTERRTPAHWSRREVLDLLSYLNNNIDHIRGLLKADRDSGIRSACEELSKALGEGFTPTRVQNKILSLWKKRSSNDSNDVDDIYYMGAYTRTLPYLDGLYPGMLEDIAAKVKLMQRCVLHRKLSLKIPYYASDSAELYV